MAKKSKTRKGDGVDLQPPFSAVADAQNSINIVDDKEEVVCSVYTEEDECSAADWTKALWIAEALNHYGVA